MFKKFFKEKNSINYLRENNEKPIEHAIFNDTVRKAFVDFVKLNKNKDVALIGGLAIGAWTRSRNTDDIDLVVLSEEDIDSIEKNISTKFKRTRTHAFEHRTYGVEIEIITPDFVKESKELIKNAIQHSKKDDINGNEIKVITPKYLIALKLGRAINTKNPKSLIDKFDIRNLIQIYGKIDLSDLNLSKEKIDLYNSLEKESEE